MSAAEEMITPIFGQITVEELRKDEALTRTVMAVVRDACKRPNRLIDHLDVEGVAKGLLNGSLQLWAVLRPPDALEGIAVTRVKDNVFELVIAGPRFEEVAPFLSRLEREARAMKCERIRVVGPSFFRKFLPEGWFEREIRFERVLAG